MARRRAESMLHTSRPAPPRRPDSRVDAGHWWNLEEEGEMVGNGGLAEGRR